ncbi:MAG TPA: chemotaxis protein CheW [Xanthobacteraceae bacterium]|nr:chemotaxis protein CheW [Xanthobacteraceae bacterium]
MDELLRDFLTETHENLDVVDVELVQFEREPNNREILAKVFRLVHTIKGTCSFVGLPRLEALAHAAEALMGRFRDGMPVTTDAVSLILSTIDRIKDILDALEHSAQEPPGADDDLIGALDRMAERAAAPAPAKAAPAERRDDSPLKAATLRVQVDTIEQLMTMVSELVLTRNQLLDIARRHDDTEFKAPLARLSHVTVELQERVMKTRMQPIGNAWSKLPRMVRDLAHELGKEIDLEMHGGDTELDRQVLEQIRDPLTHMVRNAADHGIETTAERNAAGKPGRATIRLSAFHQGGNIIVELSDDGRGLNAERIRAQAVTQGIVSAEEAEKLGDAQVHKLIFTPGFSTAAAVTSVSGRGVGMDVVQNNIDEIGGTIDVKTQRGRGTTFTIKIPLTLAIVSALIVECQGERFAVPQLAVVEVVMSETNAEHRVEPIHDSRVLRLREQLLPLESLRTLLQPAPLAPASQEDGFIVVMQVAGRGFGIVVDQVLHTEEIVVKPLSAKLRQVGLFSGSTILGDGSVILILDPNGAAAAVGVPLETTSITIERAAETKSEAEQPVSLIVFRAGSAEPKAVPVALVTRLEVIDAREIEQSGGRAMVQYRGSLMPLVSLSAAATKREGRQPLLVFMDRGRAVGLLVDEIVDIVEEPLDIKVASRTPGVLGTAVLGGRATEIVDIGYLLPQGFEDWFRRKDMRADALGRRVLFVDDSAFFRTMLVPVLQAAGYAVTTASGGHEALAIVQKEGRFAVIVSDIEMPEMNGFELAEALKSNPRTAHIPLIALSSFDTPPTLQRAREVGFRAFIAKFDRERLIAALSEPAADWVEAA